MKWITQVNCNSYKYTSLATETPCFLLYRFVMKNKSKHEVYLKKQVKQKVWESLKSKRNALALRECHEGNRARYPADIEKVDESFGSRSHVLQIPTHEHSLPRTSSQYLKNFLKWARLEYQTLEKHLWVFARGTGSRLRVENIFEVQHTWERLRSLIPLWVRVSRGARFWKKQLSLPPRNAWVSFSSKRRPRDMLR